LIEEVKRKKEFSRLPDSIVKRAVKISGEDVKKSRALLRKYFGVFLTNKILKGKLGGKEILRHHISSKKRDYPKFYGEIFENIGDVGSVIDLGSGMNGFSYFYLQKTIGEVSYLGFEASGQIVDQMNNYFLKEGFNGRSICNDLFDLQSILSELRLMKKPRVVFMFQLIDALENLKKDFSKEFILKVSSECEFIVLTLPLESISGRKKFSVERKWLEDFFIKEFEILKDFKMFGEHIFILKKK
jgi:hypothetical protein